MPKIAVDPLDDYEVSSSDIESESFIQPNIKIAMAKKA
jgi:hypothetical protein